MRWRVRALARLLVTHAYQVAPGVVSDRHELLIPADCWRLALALLDRWLDSLRLSRTLPDAILAADRIAGLTPPSIIETTGLEIPDRAARLQRWQSRLTEGIADLDPGEPGRGIVRRRWRIRDSVGLAMQEKGAEN